MTKISALSSNNLDKYEYLTGKDLDLKPSTIEQAKFEYSPLGKIFNKGLSEDDKKDGLFKRLKNIEGKIKSENKKESEPIKNEEQSKIVKDESTVADKKSKEIVPLKDKFNFIFKNFDQNFNSTGKNFLEKLAKDEKTIDYNICFLKQMINLFIKMLIFQKKLAPCMIYLLDNSMRIANSPQVHLNLFKAITSLKIIISSMKTDIKDQSEEEKNKIFGKQENVLSNAEMFLKKRVN